MLKDRERNVRDSLINNDFKSILMLSAGALKEILKTFQEITLNKVQAYFNSFLESTKKEFLDYF